MEIDRIAKQLADVPPVFKPSGAAYTAIFASFLASLEDLGASTDTLAQQLDLQTASAKWLDFWGLFFSIPRNSNESDAQYMERIQATILGGTATVAGIGAYLKEAYGLSVIITENLATCSYVITFAVPLTNGQLTTIAGTLARIRPAGVPFFPFNIVAGGMFLDTTWFLGMSYAQGAYLESPTQQYFPNLAPNTDSLIVTLPLSYLNLPTTFTG